VGHIASVSTQPIRRRARKSPTAVRSRVNLHGNAESIRTQRRSGVRARLSTNVRIDVPSFAPTLQAPVVKWHGRRSGHGRCILCPEQPRRLGPVDLRPVPFTRMLTLAASHKKPVGSHVFNFDSGRVRYRQPRGLRVPAGARYRTAPITGDTELSRTHSPIRRQAHR